METRKESLSALKVCRFCHTQNEPLSSLYEKSKAPKNSATLSTKIMSCVAIEVFPSDKMPQYICNRCKFFMDLSYGFKQICRQADQNILHFVQSGTTIDPVAWPAMLNKVFKAHTKSEFGLVKSVTQDGTTVKVTAEEMSDSEEGDDDNVYSVKIGDGSDELKSIKVITSVDTQEAVKENYKALKPEVVRTVKPSTVIVQEGCWPCDKCECTYPLKQLLTLHKSQRHRPLTIECIECNAVINSNELQKHMESLHKKKPAFDCNYCHERFAKVTKLAKHLRTHVGDRGYPCKHCEKTFLKSHHYTRHLRLKHRETTRTPSGSYTEADAYRCDECEESFSSQDELIYHSALHATQSLTCPLCQEKFNDVDTVTAHIKSHVNGAEFMCDFCELIFTTQEKLDTHITMSHDNELIYKDVPENDEDEDSMDTEDYEDDNSMDLKEVDGQMVVEIKKAGEYMLADNVSMEDDEKNEIDQSEGSELEITLNDATGPLLDSKSIRSEEPSTPKPPRPAKHESVLAKIGPGSPIVVKKPEETKRKAIQQQSSPVPSSADKKEKTNAKVESSSAAGASDLSLRLLEKELQDLKRTNTRNDVAKTSATSAKPVEAPKIKRVQMHTSTPKPRPAEKRDATITKSVAEKALQEKRPPGRPPKEIREAKNANAKEEKEVKDKSNVSVKEDKDTKEVKEKDTSKLQVVKNGTNTSNNSSIEEPVRRSTRPCKVKDYAKMIRDSPDEDEEISEEDSHEEITKESEKITEAARRVRKPPPPPKPLPATTPGSAPKKRGRPRKELGTPVVPPKIAKKEESNEELTPEVAAADKTEERNSKTADISKNEPPGTPKTQVSEPVSNVMVSPSGQTLKKIPIKALPPGIKPMPLPRKMTSGEVCEMQIGKKVVKVQKIVMTKAEVEAMTKKGLVEMKDGTIVLKQGIKLPGGGAATLKSQLAAEEQKKEPTKDAKPTRCDFGED